MPVYNKRGILLLPKVIVLNPKDGKIYAVPIDIFKCPLLIIQYSFASPIYFFYKKLR